MLMNQSLDWKDRNLQDDLDFVEDDEDGDDDEGDTVLGV